MEIVDEARDEEDPSFNGHLSDGNIIGCKSTCCLTMAEVGEGGRKEGNFISEIYVWNRGAGPVKKALLPVSIAENEMVEKNRSVGKCGAAAIKKINEVVSFR